jgi:hypothetical protein
MSSLYSKGSGREELHLPPEISSIFQRIRDYMFNDDISVYSSPQLVPSWIKGSIAEKPTFVICLIPNAVVPACKDDDEEIYNRLSYNIHMPENEDYFLDIPPHMRSLKVYSASLGHKVKENIIRYMMSPNRL